jgi:K+/H+ antiporter YhaU regulatory subunit KhtT
VRQCLPQVKTTLAEQGFDLPSGVSLVPIYGLRYLVCSPDPDSSVVLSILDGDDAIVYGDSLKEYLQREFLNDTP